MAEQFPNPQLIRLVESGPGIIGLSGNLYTNSLFRDCRASQFLEAAEASLQKRDAPELSQKGLEDIRTGAFWAANRASRYTSGEGVIVFSEPVQRLARLIGSEAFKGIYMEPIPQDVVEYLLSPEYKSSFPSYMEPDLDQITEEVLSGRLEWSDHYAEHGVTPPQEYIRQHESNPNNDLLVWGSY